MVESSSKPDLNEQIENKQFNARIRNKNTSPFISEGKQWEDKATFGLPEGILKSIIDELQFQKPSKI